MEQYASQLIYKANEEGAVKEFFALGSSRYISTYELSENYYLLYSFLQSRSICLLDYRDNLLIAPARRAVNPLLRQYAEREELEFKHGQLGKTKGTVISTIKLRHPPIVDDSEWFKDLKLKESKPKKPKTLNEYVDWVASNSTGWDLRGLASEVDAPDPEQAVRYASQTVTVPSIESIPAQEYNRCPDPTCIACNPEARQRALNSQVNARAEYIRNTTATAITVDEMPF